MPIKYIGKTTDFRGKPLWEILGNLKNFGVGRVVVRSMFERYNEPCYYRIRKVETLPNEETRKVCIWVDKVFRGRKEPTLARICGATYKSDYRLIPKDEEVAYCREDVKFENPQKILPESVSFPPLLKELLMRDLEAKGVTPSGEPKLKLVYTIQNAENVAKEGETPTVECKMGLGKPASPNLYDNII